MKNGTIIGAVAIAVGIALSGLFIKKGFDNFSYRDRVVTVRGLAEREVKANRVTWPVVYQGSADDLTTLYNNVTNNTAKIVTFLKENGLSEDEIQVNAPEVTVNQQGYGYTGPRYSVTDVVVVSSDKVDEVTALIKRQSELLKMGVTVVSSSWNNQTSYDFTELNEIKPAMVAEATANAREAANKFAEDSGSELGKMKTASQGQFSITDRDQYTPYIKNVRVVSTITYYIKD